MRTILKTISLIIICFVVLAPARAQVSGGVVTGRVTDVSGANVPNVRMELENIETGQRIAVVTDSAGVYTFTGVPAGRYRIITTSTSAATVPTQEVTVEVSRTNTIHISLPSGPGTDAQATAEQVPISERPASVDNTWNTRYTHYLPNPNFVDRNGEAFGAYNLAIFADTTVSRIPGSPNGPAFTGQRPESNLFHVQGIDNQNRLGGGPLVYLSNEATTEFSFLQNQASPLFGHTAGPNFNSIVRTGTNQVHGSVYNYLQNRHLNATDRAWSQFGFNEDNQPRYDQNRLGGSLGLPIVPSRIFFFGNFEYIPLGFQAPLGGFITAPTASGFATLEGLNGVSASNLGILRNAVGSGAPTEATGTVQVAGSNIPVGLVDNVQRNWQNQRVGAGSLDFRMSDKDQLTARFVYNDLEANWSGLALQGTQTPRWQRSLLANVSHYHTFENAVTNELRLGYNRIDAEQYMNGVTGPAVRIGSGMNLAIGPQFSPSGINNTWHIADTVNFRLGGHDLKLGFDGRRFLGFRNNFANLAGVYQYSSLNRFLLDQSPDVAASRAFGGDRLDLSQWLFFGFAHDTWKVHPKFTLDLGVRYQYAKIPNAFRNQGFNSDLNVPGVIEFTDPKLQRWNFAPYFGFAAQPWTNRTVFRGGFGMWYDAAYWQPFTMGFAPQVTRVATGNLNNTTSGFLSGGGLSDPGDRSRSAVSSFIGEQRMPYSMQWNLALQQAFWRATTIEFRYMGNRGVNQPMYSQLNYNGVTEQRSLPVFSSAQTQAQLNALPLTLSALQSPLSNSYTAAGFVNPLYTINFGANSWYHGATVALNHNFTGGLQLNANYTWSRWEDDATGTPLDIGMPNRMRTWSMFDHRHQANVTAMFEVAPLFRNSWSVVRNVFADFNLAGTYNYQSGSSLTPVAGINSALANNAFGTGVILNNPNASGMDVSTLNPLRNSGGQIVAYQPGNPNARFIQPAAGVFSGFNRGGIMLNDLHNVNVAAVKRFNAGERASFEIRGEAFNVFNRTNQTGYSVNSIGFGMMPSLGMIPGTIDVNNLANLSLLPSNPRTLQLALRVSF
jgi:hypothetical protein